MLSLFLGMATAHAEDGLTVRDLSVFKSGRAMLAIETAFESDVFFGYQLEVVLPKGLFITLNDEGKPTAESHTVLDIVGSVLRTTDEATTYQFVATKMGNPTIPSGNYLLVTMPIETDGTLDVGSVLNCSVSNILFSDGTQTGKALADQTFVVTVSDKVILDENSPAVPIGTDEEVDILLKRTIKANQWSTLCLPFDMTEEQVYAAFGSDVQFAAFEKYELSDGIITVFFADINMAEEGGLYANYPYIIKTSQDISQFEVTAAISPSEEDAVEKYIKRVGRKDVVVGTFTGTLHAGTVIPAENLFLSDNKFFYSVGKTKCKAFRAYFWFQDVIADYSSADSRISLQVNAGSSSGIRHNDVDIHEVSPYNNDTYDLQGRHVMETHKVTPYRKGLYIHNGRKEVIK